MDRQTNIQLNGQSNRQTKEQINGQTSGQRKAKTDRQTIFHKQLLPDKRAYFGKKFHNLRVKWIQLELLGCQIQPNWYSELDNQLKIGKLSLG